MNYTAIIPAAGSGSRMGLGFNKVLYEVEGQSIILRTVKCFENDINCTGIIVATGDHDIDLVKEELKNMTKVLNVIPGGKERQDSIYNCLLHVQNSDYVFIHDGARPFLHRKILERLKTAVTRYKAVICGVQAKNTLKKVEDGKVIGTINRATAYEVHTPQAFCYNLLMNAYEYARMNHLKVTDDSMIMEFAGETVHVVDSSYDNIKITTKEDIKRAQTILRSVNDENWTRL